MVVARRLLVTHGLNLNTNGMKKAFLLTAIILATAFATSLPSPAQLYKFHKLGFEKGICHPFVYSINQDKNGFIWALTGTGLCRFDGFNFTKNGGSRDSLPEISAEISFKDPENNLWFGYNDGSIVYYDNKKFKLISPEENENGKITGIAIDNQKNIIVSNQNNGFIIINPAFNKTLIQEPFENLIIYCFAITTDNKLLVGTDDGVQVFQYDAFTKKINFINKIENIPAVRINKIVKQNEKNGYWISTEAGLYVLTFKEKSYQTENFGDKLKLSDINVQSVFEDKNKELWLSTFGNGLYKITIQENEIKRVINYHTENGLSRDDIKEVFKDREGNMWIATYGGGIANLPFESFIAYDFKKEFKNNNITAVCFDKDGYWIGGTNGLIHMKTGIERRVDFFGQNKGLPLDIITTLFRDPKGTIWIGTSKNGIFNLPQNASRIVPVFRADNSLANSINAINGSGKEIFAATRDGVYKFNLQSGERQHISTSQGLPHNDISQVFIDSKGTAWVATHSNNLFSINNDIKFDLKGAGEIDFTSIGQDNKGDIWVGTNGNGVFQFKKDTFRYFSTREGLKSDYCYALTCDKFGNTWIGHRMGVSRINSASYKIMTYGNEFFSGDINPNAIAENDEGEILFGTTDGLISYEPSKEKKASVPPIINITSITINDSVFGTPEKITLPYSHYRIKIDFIGLNFSNPEQVTYQYKLEGFETEWSGPTTNREIRYPRLEDGNYVLMIKACNGYGYCTENLMALELKIRKPFWKTWWFFTLLIIILISSVYFIIKLRERKQKEFQAYLEKLLDERTREVREQKEEIELINRDITDSINYAQRIQASILPSLRKLQHLFTGSFVYYLPRNIVSGDFYWFEVIPNTNKFLIVCADSTGHGVPGAFMSIIGTTLLKDIFSRPEVKKPSDILKHLDNELKSTLNQDLDGERPNDGMDIIVCEIDIKSYYARFSSAMRPFIVYQNGEQLYFKGSRSSIGGQVKEEKIFEDIELQLTKGDLIYMFSDGYPDQFGGPLGKKFKMVRLRNLLKDIYQKPMEEQYNYVKSNFELWRGDHEQVDDVLFMGIKM